MMSTTTVTDDTDDSLIIVVNADGTVTVDPETLQRLLAQSCWIKGETIEAEVKPNGMLKVDPGKLRPVNSFANTVSLVHVNNPGSGSETADSNDSSFNLTVESFVPPARSSDNNSLLQDLTDGDVGNDTDPFSQMEPEHIARLESALKSEQAKEILGTKLDGGLSNMLNILQGKSAPSSTTSAGRNDGFPTSGSYPPPEVLIDHSYSVLASNAPHGFQQQNLSKQPAQSPLQRPPLRMFHGPRMRGVGTRGLKTLGGVQRTVVSSQQQAPVVSLKVQAKEVTTHKYTMGPDGPIPVSSRKVTTPHVRTVSPASSPGRTVVQSSIGPLNILGLSSGNRSTSSPQLIKIPSNTLSAGGVDKKTIPLVAGKIGTTNVLLRKGVAVRTIKANQKLVHLGLTKPDEPMDTSVTTSTPDPVDSSRESDDSETSGAEESLIVDPSIMALIKKKTPVVVLEKLDIESSDGESEAEIRSPSQDQEQSPVAKLPETISSPAQEDTALVLEDQDPSSEEAASDENSKHVIPDKETDVFADSTSMQDPPVQPTMAKLSLQMRKPAAPKRKIPSAAKTTAAVLSKTVDTSSPLRTTSGLKQLKKAQKPDVNMSPINAKPGKMVKKPETVKIGKPAENQKTSPPKVKSPKSENATVVRTDAVSSSTALPKTIAPAKLETAEAEDKAKEKEKEKKKKDSKKSTVLTPLVLGPELFSKPDIIRRVSTDKIPTSDGLLSPNKETSHTPTSTTVNVATLSEEKVENNSIVSAPLESTIVQETAGKAEPTPSLQHITQENLPSPGTPVLDELPQATSADPLAKEAVEIESQVDEFDSSIATASSEDPVVRTAPTVKVEVQPAHPDIPCNPILGAESLLNSIHEKLAKTDPAMLREELLYDLTNDDYDVDFPGFAKIEDAPTADRKINVSLATGISSPAEHSAVTASSTISSNTTLSCNQTLETSPSELSSPLGDPNIKVRKLPPIEVPKTRSATKKASSSPSQSPKSPVKKSTQPPAVVTPPAKEVEKVTPKPVGKIRVSTDSHQSITSERRDSLPTAAETDYDDEDADRDDASWNSEDDPDKLWCICRKPHNNRFMICCDGCEDWFHGKCVGVTKSLGQQMEAQGVEWSCPKCRAANREKEKANSLAAKNAKMPANQKTLGSLECITCKKPAKAASNFCCENCIKKHAVARVSVLKTEVPNLFLSTRVSVYNKTTGVLLEGEKAPMVQKLADWLVENPSYEILTPSMLSSKKYLLSKQSDLGPKVMKPSPKLATNDKAVTKLVAKPVTKAKDKQDSHEVPEKVVNRRPSGDVGAVKNLKQSVLVPKVVRGEVKVGYDSKIAGSTSPKKIQLIQPQALTISQMESAQPKGKIDGKKTTKPQTPSGIKPPALTSPTQSLSDKKKEESKAKKERKTKENESKLTITPSQFFKSISTPTTPKTPVSSSSKTPVSSIPKTPASATPKTPVSTTPKTPASTASKTPVPSVSTPLQSTPVSSTTKEKTAASTEKAKEAPASEKEETKQESVRDNVKRMLHENLMLRVNQDSELNTPSDEVKTLADSIEEELFNLFKDTNMKYRTKFRSLVFNIKDAKNLTLYRKIVDRTISPEQFVRLTAEELASQELAQWREKEAKHQIDIIKKNELALIHQAKTVVLKSRKGEEIIESKNHEANISELESALNRTADDYEEPPTVKKDNEIGSLMVGLEKVVAKDDKAKEKDKERRRDRKRSHRSRSKSRGRDRKRSRSRSKERSKRNRANSKEKSRDRSKRNRSRSKEKPSKRSRSRGRSKSRSRKDGQKTRDRSKSVASPTDASLSVETLEVESGSASLLDSKMEGVGSMTPPPPSFDDDLEPSSTTFIATPPTPEEKPPVWTGCLSNHEVARLRASAFEVSGCVDDLDVELSDTLECIGRIQPDTVWDYISRMKKGGTKDIIVLRFEPLTDDERIHYVSLYSYLSTRNRMAVVGNASKTIKDFYVMPLASHSPIPQVLLPLDGPGFDETRNHLLLAIIVRNRRHSVYGSVPSYTTNYCNSPNVMRSRSTSSGQLVKADRSYTPPLPDGGSTTPPLPAMPAKSLPLPPIASMTEDVDDDDTPYDPGESLADEGDQDAPYTPTASPPGLSQNISESHTSHPDIAKNLEEVEKLIEEKKQKIEALIPTAIPGLGDTPPEYPAELKLKVDEDDEDGIAMKAGDVDYRLPPSMLFKSDIVDRHDSANKQLPPKDSDMRLESKLLPDIQLPSDIHEILASISKPHPLEVPDPIVKAYTSGISQNEETEGVYSDDESTRSEVSSDALHQKMRDPRGPRPPKSSARVTQGVLGPMPPQDGPPLPPLPPPTAGPPPGYFSSTPHQHIPMQPHGFPPMAPMGSLPPFSNQGPPPQVMHPPNMGHPQGPLPPHMGGPPPSHMAPQLPHMRGPPPPGHVGGPQHIGGPPHGYRTMRQSNWNDRRQGRRSHRNHHGGRPFRRDGDFRGRQPNRPVSPIQDEWDEEIRNFEQRKAREIGRRKRSRRSSSRSRSPSSPSRRHRRNRSPHSPAKL